MNSGQILQTVSWKEGVLQTFKAEPWDPQPYAKLFKLPATPSQRRAYQILQLFKTPKSTKLLREWETFVRFCHAAELAVELGEVIMLNPNSSMPPPPDLACAIRGEPHFFELGEILQEDIAKAAAGKSKRKSAEPPNSVLVSQLSPSAGVIRSIPLAKIWLTLDEMLVQKLGKRYHPKAKASSLVLYFATSNSFWPALRPLVTEKKGWIQEILDPSHFDNVFLFDAREAEVLIHFSRRYASRIF
jgi:hypothetical protein